MWPGHVKTGKEVIRKEAGEVGRGRSGVASRVRAGALHSVCPPGPSVIVSGTLRTMEAAHADKNTSPALMEGLRGAW